MAEKMTIETVSKKKDRELLMELFAERSRWTRQRREAEEMEKACTEQIVPILLRLDIASIDANDDQGGRKRFLVIHGGSSTVDRKLLLMKNVDPEIIEACTKRTEYTTLQMRDIKDT